MSFTKKRLLSVVIFIIFFNLSIFGQLSLQSQQILLPKKVYIGDQAELRCSFATKSDLSGLLEMEELPFTNFTDGLVYEEYEIKKIRLQQTGPGNYILVLNFIPWKTGYLRLPAYMLKEDEKLLLKFEDISISSLTENGALGLQDQLPPLLLPGTSYKLYGILIALVLVLIVLIRLIVKHDDVARAIENRKLLKKYKRNKKSTVKNLSILLKKPVSDVDFAQSVQQLMRKYLEVRFDEPFTKTVSSGIYSVFERATCGVLCKEKYDAVEGIQQFFIRTDFIRYAQNNQFNDTVTFDDNEKKSMVEKLIAAIETLEKIEKPVEGGNDNA